MSITKAISVTLPGGATANVAVVKSMREDPGPVLIYDLCREEHKDGVSLLITLQADCFNHPSNLPFDLTEIEQASLTMA